MKQPFLVLSCSSQKIPQRFQKKKNIQGSKNEVQNQKKKKKKSQKCDKGPFLV